MVAQRNLVKTPSIVHGFWPESENFQLRQKRIPSKRASQEELNGTNFSFVAPSSEELWLRKEIWSKRLTIVHGFWPESENFNFGKKGYHRKGHLKRS